MYHPIKFIPSKKVTPESIRNFILGFEGLPNEKVIDLQNDEYSDKLLIRLTSKQFILIENPPDYSNNQIYVQVLDIDQVELEKELAEKRKNLQED